MTATHVNSITSPLIRLASVGACLAAVMCVPLLVARADGRASIRWDDVTISRAVVSSDDLTPSRATPAQAARMERIEKTTQTWNRAWLAATPD